jgi:uncharacterized membrane protein
VLSDAIGQKGGFYLEGIEKASENLFIFMALPLVRLSLIMFALITVISFVYSIYKAIKPKKYRLLVNGVEDKEAIITEIK